MGQEIDIFSKKILVNNYKFKGICNINNHKTIKTKLNLVLIQFTSTLSFYVGQSFFFFFFLKWNFLSDVSVWFFFFCYNKGETTQ